MLDRPRQMQQALNESEEETYQRVMKVFLEYGFSGRESEWAAEHNLDPILSSKRGQILHLLRNRILRVQNLMRYSKLSFEEVVNLLDGSREANNIAKGEEDLDNLFTETP